MHIFEYSGITEAIPSDIVDTLTEIGTMHALEPLRLSAYGKELKPAEEKCISDSAGASLKMEDVVGTDDIAELQYRGLIGYYKRMFSDGRRPGTDETSLLEMHRIIMNGATKRDSRFRIRDVGAVEDEHVRAIRPLPSGEIPRAVEQMGSSFTMAMDIGIQPLLLVPCMIVDLLNIHPFTEGNWRISRALLCSMLISSGYESLRYSSLESKMLLHTEDYYDAVAESSAGWNSNDSDPFPFIRFVTDIVRGCYREIEARYPLNLGKKMRKNERILGVVQWSDTPLTKAEICGLLPDISVRTADVVLTGLVSDKSITKLGTFRDARYE